MTQRFYPRIKGLIPLIDRKQSAEPFVVSGKNFVITAQGPISALGREIVSYKGIKEAVNVQFFEVSETIESFITTDEGIFRLDTETSKLVPLYIFSFRLDSQYPFTLAAVGNKYYFAREGYPMIQYTISTNSWQELSGGSIPLNIYACIESEGRLVVLTDTWIAWTAIGDGEDFVASQFTGAGAQAITKIGFANSTPIGLRKTPEGYLAFLSTGIIRAQAIQALIPYRHTILSRDHVPLNPFCISSTVDQSIIILTTAGLFKTQGQIPELWQPIMGQYLKENIIPKLDLITNQNNPQLFFDFDNTWFVVAVSENQTPYVFTKAYILNIPIDEWGSLDTNFVTLVNVKILPLKFIGFSYGLVDTQGSIYIINNARGVETIPELSNGLYYNRLVEEFAGVINSDVLRFAGEFNWRTVPVSDMNTTGMFNRWGDGENFNDPENITAIEKAVEVCEWDCGQTNLLTYSDQFDHANWVAVNSPIITANTHIAPDGTLTADTIQDDSDISNEGIYQNASSFDVTKQYTVSIYIKKDGIPRTTRFSSFRLWFDGSTVENNQIKIDTSTGEFELSGVDSNLSGDIVDEEDYWLIWISGKSQDQSNTSAALRFLSAIGQSLDWSTDSSTLGSAIVWRAQLVECSTLQPDAKTTDTIKTGACLPNATDSILEFKTNTIFSAGIINVATIVESKQYESLNSLITIGPFRLTDEQSHDMYSYINGLILGMTAEGVGEISEDWNSNIEYPSEVSEDWMLLDGEEDWGDDPVGSVQFNISIIPTLDAYTPFAADNSTIELIKYEGNSLVYSCYSNGIYHLITIDATSLDDNFYLKTVDANINMGGHML